MPNPMQGEIGQALADPNAAINIAFGPPFPELVPQDPNSGLRVAGLYERTPLRFVFKKAHLSREDFRIFNQATGKLVCVSHHHGKNPYAALDPLGVGYDPNQHQLIGEMESLCNVTGYGGMKSFKIRPKKLSMHGRQLAIDGDRTMFSIGKLSRIKSMSLRHNLEVCLGESKDTMYTIEVDLMGRTMSFKNQKDELVAFAKLSNKALIMSQLVGSGSETIIDVAPGVDWTAILACMMVLQQIGAHYAKDIFNMWVIQPGMSMFTDTVTEATGTAGYVQQLGQMTNTVVHGTQQAQSGMAQFNQLNHGYNGPPTQTNYGYNNGYNQPYRHQNFY